MARVRRQLDDDLDQTRSPGSPSPETSGTVASRGRAFTSEPLLRRVESEPSTSSRNPDDDAGGFSSLNQLLMGNGMAVKEAQVQSELDTEGEPSIVESDEPSVADLKPDDVINQEEVEGIQKANEQGAELNPVDIVQKKRRVAGLLAELKNLWYFVTGDEKANTTSALVTALMTSAKVLKASFGPLESYAKFIPFIGIPVAVIDALWTWKSQIVPLKRMDQEHTKRITAMREAGKDDKDITPFETIQRQIRYELGWAKWNAFLAGSTLVTQVAGVLTGGLGWIATGLALGIQVVSAAAKLLIDAWRQHKAAKAEAYEQDRSEEMNLREQQLREITGPHSQATDEEKRNALDQYRDAVEAHDVAHQLMLEKSNHAAFLDILRQAFAPVAEGETDALDQETFDFLSSYGLTRTTIKHCELNAKEGTDLPVSAAIDDLKTFLAVGEPRTIPSRFAGAMAGLGRWVARRVGRLLGTIGPEDLSSRDKLNFLVMKKFEPVGDFVTRAASLGKPLDDTQSLALNRLICDPAGKKGCAFELADRLKDGIAQRDDAEMTQILGWASEEVRFYLQRKVDMLIRANLLPEGSNTANPFAEFVREGDAITPIARLNIGKVDSGPRRQRMRLEAFRGADPMADAS